MDEEDDNESDVIEIKKPCNHHAEFAPTMILLPSSDPIDIQFNSLFLTKSFVNFRQEPHPKKSILKKVNSFWSKSSTDENVLTTTPYSTVTGSEGRSVTSVN